MCTRRRYSRATADAVYIAQAAAFAQSTYPPVGARRSDVGSDSQSGMGSGQFGQDRR
jgi:hypothetical protein